MNRLVARIMLGVILFTGQGSFYNKGMALKANDLYALSACLMDADSGRVLYEKNGYEVRAMASTTKIMTLIIALEYGNMEDVVTVSPYAAGMPDVQLNIKAGEQYYLKDLCYAMMLESYNDVAVAIAEHIGMQQCGNMGAFSAGNNMAGETADNISERDKEVSKSYVSAFAGLMNEKAKSLGCTNTYFITPNGLDAEDENGKHSSTAVEMALIGSYAVKNQDFNVITGTKSYSFNEINGKRSCSANNRDAFLNQMEGAFGIKTGFTNDAGYCFVGALKSDGRTFVSVVLASGWPGNKTYKWKDTRNLMEYGINNFFLKKVFEGVDEYKEVQVYNGKTDSVQTEIEGELSLLIADTDVVKVIYELEDYVYAPVMAGQEVGKAIIYINDIRYTTFPIVTKEGVEKVDYMWFFDKVVEELLMIE